jgi:hypothetical protein
MSTAKFDTWMNTDGTTNYKCRAWVNFDGTTSPGTIRASGNVSSVTRNNTGDYTVNFTTAMPDANYSAFGTCSVEGSESATRNVAINQRGVTGQTTTSVRLWVSDDVSSANRQVVNVSIFR